MIAEYHNDMTSESGSTPQRADGEHSTKEDFGEESSSSGISADFQAWVLIDKTKKSPACGQANVGMKDALSFIDRVKTEFDDSPRVYSEFLCMMKRYKDQEVNTATVVDCFSRMFRGRPDLILAFNVFLPDGFEIPLQDEEVQDEMTTIANTPMEMLAAMAAVQPMVEGCKEDRQSTKEESETSPKQPVAECSPCLKTPERAPSFDDAATDMAVKGTRSDEFNHALDFVGAVKERFPSNARNQESKYQKFMSILQDFKNDKLDMESAVSQVSALFENHPDLLQGFVYFLPDHMQAKAREFLKSEGSPREQAVQSSRSFGNCVLCVLRPRSHTFVPCGHLCVCETCASRTVSLSTCASRTVRFSGSCPICKKQVKEATRVSLS